VVLEVNVKLTLEYDGTDFHGWQFQPGLRTVQGVIEERLGEMLSEPVRLIGAGRTDAGVHALGQVANFHTGLRFSPDVIRRGLNAMLPPDVVVLSAGACPDPFHARFDARRRCYRYRLSRRRRAVGRAYTWSVSYALDVEAMQRVAQAFLGRQSFASFCNAASERSGYTCHVSACSWRAQGEDLFFEVTSDRFLRGMVRTMVGTLLEVGRGKMPVQAVRNALDAQDRRASRLTAPAHGLCLVRVDYDEDQP
jgi:tRNA pseudouridine38-40 synthase